MPLAQILMLTAAVAGAGAVVGATVQLTRRRSLRRTYGPEYEQALVEGGYRAAAERELRERERHQAELELRPLDPADQDRYEQQWQAVATQFVEDPAAAVVAGDDLMTRLVGARGYPTKDFEDRLPYLSAEHARTLGHFRDAHDIYLRGQRGDASTGELRQALVHYRALIADLAP